ncbi:cation diffusion facilitator family transporter [Alkalihalobacillus sp. TS-13]|uniref:cation diffusion facilitator family transporter n=1 Tax=Alkalihalobacillus sp. TS-13 TaxID=2842455 RepID=UPI001C8808AE|nr:cation diffusion facilitator family transporter [Alkalihalobacillus sp. TS-13]
MGHQHDHHANKKALKISFLLISLFMIVEVIGGIVTNSLALLSDAGHMFSDAASLGLSFLAIHYGSKKPSDNKTFGYKRFEILAAFINGIALIVISFIILFEAYHRFIEPPYVAGDGMLSIAIIGLVVNLIVAYILMKGDTSGNLNMKSAFLHVLGDLFGSVGAIIAAIFIIVLDWGYADPIASVFVSLLILISGWRVTKEAIHVLMEGTPDHINIEEIKSSLSTFPEIKNIHDLHVWSITSGYIALSCHITIEEETDHQQLLKQASDHLKEDFHINHTTIQIEYRDRDCDPCN